jgi:hypothetical protein
MKPNSFGHLLEGTIEQDPLTDRYVLRVKDAKGRPGTVDLQALFAHFVGQEVRLTLASFENLNKLAQLVESQGGGGQVLGLHPSELPVPFNIVRKT